MKELRGLVKDVSDVEIVVAPPFTAVHAAAEAARNTEHRRRGAGLYWEREGAFTGEVVAGDDQGGRRRVRRSSATPSGGGCSARPTRS